MMLFIISSQDVVNELSNWEQKYPSVSIKYGRNANSAPSGFNDEKFIEHELILLKDSAKFPDATVAECLAIKTLETLCDEKRLPVFFINRKYVITMKMTKWGPHLFIFHGYKT